MTYEKTEEELAEHHKEQIFDLSVVLVFAMLIIYMMFSAFRHKHGVVFGHEACLVTLIGFGISYAYQAAGSKDFAELMKFSDELFFYFCLPPIIFANGFNL